MIDVEDLPAAAGQNQEASFLELGNKADVADVVARVIHAVFFFNDERHVEIVVARRFFRRAGR